MQNYCIDTSALIDGWKDYPLEHFGVWDEIQKLINEERLVSPYHVLGELKVRDDDLHKWCNEKDLLFSSPTENTVSIEKEIISKYSGFKPKKRPKADWADPWVISIAIENEYIVISHETKKTPEEKTWYIPDICSDFGVQHIRFLDLIKEEKWEFR